MTACNYLNLLVIGLIIVGWNSRLDAAGTGTEAAASTTATTSVEASGSAKTPAHKSSHHKKKKSTVAAEDSTGSQNGSVTVAAMDITEATPVNTPAVTKKKHSRAKTHSSASVSSAQPDSMSSDASGPLVVPPAISSSGKTVGSTSTSGTVNKFPNDASGTITITAPAPAPSRLSGGPEVETGLPVARHSGHDSATGVDSRTSSYEIASAFPVPGAATSIGSYTPPRSRIKSPLDNFTFTNFSRHVRNSYPWKLDIITTVFWIGEGATPISSTTNVSSAWDEEWRNRNGGSDTPDDRSGYMPAHHAARENPFYIALPFNDLAFPDKARRWLPAGWYRAPRDGKQVSACKDRWVEIKNAQGETCYAQWEDVGPLRYDHAEYVFGDDRPDTYSRAGLDVSPAVADYLNITGKNRLTRWRFVDDADVQPGMWLKYDEEALIFSAMHSLKQDPTHILPIQKASAPIDDEDDVNSAKRKIGAAKG